MAYTAKIETEADLNKIPRSRPNYNLFTSIARIVLRLFDVPVIYDPQKNYKVVKISRSLEKQGKKITAVINEIKRETNLNISTMEIKFGDGSLTRSATADTADQENATKFVCESLIEKGSFPKFEDVQRIHSNVDDDWIDSYQASALQLKDHLGSNKGYEYSRDDGIMPYLQKQAKICGKVTNSDAWNPMDIVLIRKSKKSKIYEEIEDLECLKEKQYLDALNDVMRRYFQSNDLLGVSLKKLNVKKSIKKEVANLSTPIDPSPLSFKRDVKLDMDFKSLTNNQRMPENFKTLDMSILFQIGKNDVTCAYRSFTNENRAPSYFELKYAGASAQLGKASNPEAVAPYFKRYSFTLPNPKQVMPAVGDWTPKDIDDWATKADNVKDYKPGGVEINWGSRLSGAGNFKDTFKSILETATEIEKDDTKVARALSVKCQSIMILNYLNHIERKEGDLKSFILAMYYGAKKQYATAGVFLKIYDM